MSKIKSHYWNEIEEMQLPNDYVPDPDYHPEENYDIHIGESVEDYLNAMYEFYKDKI